MCFPCPPLVSGIQRKKEGRRGTVSSEGGRAGKGGITETMVRKAGMVSEEKREKRFKREASSGCPSPCRQEMVYSFRILLLPNPHCLLNLVKFREH